MLQLTKTSIPALFQKNAAQYGDRPCTAYRDAARGGFVDISWKAMNDMVHRLGWYLLSQGVKKGDRVAIFSGNSPQWWVADLAILSIGAVTVPIYATNSVEEAHYVLANSGSRLCITGGADHREKTVAALKRLPGFKRIIAVDSKARKDTLVIPWAEALAAGAAYRNKGEFDKRLAAVKEKDLATLIYTSGTTGNPKGVMLSHGNFLANVRQVLTDYNEFLEDRHVLISFLPLSHSLERTAGYYLPMVAGCKVAFAEDFAKVVDNMKEVHPTIIISVPRLYEKIHSVILARVAEAPPLKRLLFHAAVRTAARNLPYVCEDRTPTGLLALRVKLFERLVFSKFREGLGMDKLEIAVSGGAPLSLSDAEFFIGMGIKVLEGFGLTETTPITNVNPLRKIKPGTVGPAVSETQIRIADDGELQIKGPQVMMGYYKNPKATREVFTKDGYFKTGDLAMLDEDGYLRITGRIKDIIVTAGGKNISPQNIENSLKASPYIEQVAVIGDRRKYLSALVIPAFEAVEKWAAREGITAGSRPELIHEPAVVALLGREIEKYTKHFSRVEQIRKFSLLDAEWTQDTGEITPSLKVKRNVIEKKYRSQIEEMYLED